MIGSTTSIVEPPHFDGNALIATYNTNIGSGTDSSSPSKRWSKSDNNDLGTSTIDASFHSSENSFANSLRRRGTRRFSGISVAQIASMIQRKSTPSAATADGGEQDNSTTSVAQEESVAALKLSNEFYRKILDQEREKNMILIKKLKKAEEQLNIRSKQKELAELRLLRMVKNDSSNNDKNMLSESDGYPKLMHSTNRDHDPSSITDLEKNSNIRTTFEQSAEANVTKGTGYDNLNPLNDEQYPHKVNGEGFVYPEPSPVSKATTNKDTPKHHSTGESTCETLYDEGCDIPKKETNTEETNSVSEVPTADYGSQSGNTPVSNDLPSNSTNMSDDIFHLEDISDTSLTVTPYVAAPNEDLSSLGVVNGEKPNDYDNRSPTLVQSEDEMDKPVEEPVRTTYDAATESWNNSLSPPSEQRATSRSPPKLQSDWNQMPLANNRSSKMANRCSAIIGNKLLEVDLLGGIPSEKYSNNPFFNHDKKTGEDDNDEGKLGGGVRYIASAISSADHGGIITRAQPSLDAPTVSCKVPSRYGRTFNSPLGGLKEVDIPNSSQDATSHWGPFFGGFEDDSIYPSSSNRAQLRNYNKTRRKPILGRTSVTAYKV